jgi:hypothetical protein
MCRHVTLYKAVYVLEKPAASIFLFYLRTEAADSSEIYTV